jgi:hypothetical protein
MATIRIHANEKAERAFAEVSARAKGKKNNHLGEIRGIAVFHLWD